MVKQPNFLRNVPDRSQKSRKKIVVANCVVCISIQLFSFTEKTYMRSFGIPPLFNILHTILLKVDLRAEFGKLGVYCPDSQFRSD